MTSILEVNFNQIEIEQRIRRLAERQHGVFKRRQLIELGLGPKLIDYRVAAGQLELVYRGVYALNAALLSREGRWLAAVMAIGPDAVLSHRSAAALWRIRKNAPAMPAVRTG